MAKAIFNYTAQVKGLPYRAESAGTEPAGKVHPVVLEAMKEAGIDLSTATPHLLTNEMANAAGKIFTMGCAVDAGVCPAVFIKGMVDWGLPDPKGKSLSEVRAIRDDIQRRVESLLQDLQLTPSP